MTELAASRGWVMLLTRVYGDDGILERVSFGTHLRKEDGALVNPPTVDVMLDQGRVGSAV